MGYLVYLVDGDCPVVRVSFSPTFSMKVRTFSRAGCQKGTFSLEQVISNTRLIVNLSEFVQLSYGLCRNLLDYNAKSQSSYPGFL